MEWWDKGHGYSESSSFPGKQVGVWSALGKWKAQKEWKHCLECMLGSRICEPDLRQYFCFHMQSKFQVLRPESRKDRKFHHFTHLCKAQGFQSTIPYMQLLWFWRERAICQFIPTNLMVQINSTSGRVPALDVSNLVWYSWCTWHPFILWVQQEGVPELWAGSKS